MNEFYSILFKMLLQLAAFRKISLAEVVVKLLIKHLVNPMKTFVRAVSEIDPESAMIVTKVH